MPVIIGGEIVSPVGYATIRFGNGSFIFQPVATVDPIAFVAADALEFAATIDVVYTIPNSVQVGDRMFLDLGKANEGTFLTPSGWALDPLVSRSTLHVQTFSKIADVNDPGSTLTLTNSWAFKTAVAFTALRNVSGVADYAVRADQSGTTDISTNPATATADDSIQLSTFFERSTNVTDITPPVEMDLRAKAIGLAGGHVSVLTGSRSVNTGVATTISATTVGAAHSHALSITRILSPLSGPLASAGFGATPLGTGPFGQ